MIHTIPLFITQKIALYTEVPDQLVPPLQTNTWAPIGLASPCTVANPIGTSSLTLGAISNWSVASSKRWGKRGRLGIF